MQLSHYATLASKLTLACYKEVTLFKTVTHICDWLGSVSAAGNRFEWETSQTQSSEQMKHAAQGNLDWIPG